MKTKIGIILHDSETHLDFSYLADRLDCEIYFTQGVMEYAIGAAQQLERDCKVSAIISSAATARIISPHLTVPVVPLYINSFNLVDAFVRAQKLGSTFAFIDITEDCIYNLEQITDMIGCDIKRYDFHAVSETEDVVQRAIADHRDVIVTAANCMYSCAISHHLQAVLIHMTEQDIIGAIDTVKKLLAIQNQETEKSKWLSAIVENSGDGLITIDDMGRITLVNSFAQTILHIPEAELIGHKAAEFAEQRPILKAISGASKELVVVRDDAKEYIVGRKAVTLDSSYLGSVIYIRVLKELQEAELFARKKILEHGFIAQNTFDDIIGQNEQLVAVRKKAQRYAQTNSTVLILGESGCGKELFAQGTHNASARKNGPFVAINCATLPENLLDSELFGYEGGAFTGAKRSGKAGLFELSHGGTLFLDEIGELPVQLQSKLLRTLQEKSVRRIGGSRNIPIDVRIILATNRNLSDEVAKGSFREDLYYRVNILALIIPPLRDRKDDIPLLAQNYFSHLMADHPSIFSLTEEHLSRLRQYDWPGNVRELYNFVERLAAMQSSEPDVAAFDGIFDSLFSELTMGAPAAEKWDGQGDGEHLLIPISTMREIEQIVIQQLLTQYQGNKREVEKILDISTTTLWRRLKDTP